MRSIAGVSLAILLTSGAAIAQTDKVPTESSPPAASSGTSGAGSKAMPPATTSRSAGTTANAPVRMNADDRLASRIIGATIRNAANESIGDVNDLVVDQSGRVKAVIAGVGGFLGIGEQRVLLGFDELQLSRDASGRIVVTSSMSRDQLKALPVWTEPGAADSSKR